MERKVQPIQPIKRAKLVRRVRLHHKLVYRPKLQRNRIIQGFIGEGSKEETTLQNHKHSNSDDGIGGHIDFKV